MQSLMPLACFVQKLSKKNLWGSARPPPPLGKGRVKVQERKIKTILLKISEGLIDPVPAYTLGLDETDTAKSVS